MDRIRTPGGALVLVCDGEKALLFRNIGDAGLISLKTVDARVEPHPPTRELGTERPGRAYESVGSSRSAQEPTDLHDAAETDFLTATVKAVEEIARAEAAKSLVVIAPPRALSVIRREMSPRLREIVVGEIDKDLTNFPTPEIEKHLTEAGKLR